MSGERLTDWDGAWTPAKDEIQQQIDAFERAIDQHPLVLELGHEEVELKTDKPPVASWD